MQWNSLFKSIFLLLFFLIILISFPLAAETYRLRPGDLIEFSLWDQDYSYQQRIRSDGMINVPPAGDLRVKGYTPDEVKNRLRRMLEPYYDQPQVVISVKEYAQIEVGIMGAVEKPGIYLLPYQSRVLKALTRAEGLLAEADVRGAYLNRGGYRVSLSTEDVTDQGLHNYLLRDGDAIYFPTLVNSIHFMGQVSEPGVYDYNPGMTLMQALVRAGGLTWRAEQREVRIIREDAPATELLIVNIDDIMEDRMGDPRLEPGDVIIVEGKEFLNAVNISSLLVTIPLLFIMFGN